MCERASLVAGEAVGWAVASYSPGNRVNGAGAWACYGDPPSPRIAVSAASSRAISPSDPTLMRK